MSTLLCSPLRAERVANTTLKVPLVPAVHGYQIVDAFPGVSFSRPVGLVTQPGETNRLFIVEQNGYVYVITNLANPTKTLFLDISPVDQSDGEAGLLGMAFHPDWRSNGLFYIFYMINTTVNDVSGRFDRLSRFEIDPANPNAALRATEQSLISQLDEYGNHNAGDLHFGPDGYLYVSLGDEGGTAALVNSRYINKDFFGAILRLDVDKRPGSLSPNSHPAVHKNTQGQAHYAVPSDNPFVGATSFNGSSIDPNTVRTEFWAVGLRNPWRFSFDPVTGLLYCGDVGQKQREEVDIIVKGGDYGWFYREGKIRYNGTVPPGVTLLDPIWDYPHSGGPLIPGPDGSRAEGVSVIGGVVYRGNRFAQMQGLYIFGDYGSGLVFGLRYNQQSGMAEEVQQLTSMTTPVAFGIDPRTGDVLIAGDGRTGSRPISRLIYSEQPVAGEALPTVLSDTGAFSSLAALTPEAGIVPYDLNLPFWSDHAIKSRWFSIPDTTDTMTFNRAGNWLFPTGTVWIKHFDLELTNGVAASRRRLETRFLVKNNSGSHGFTYRWNAPQTDGDLVSEGGQNEAFTIYNPDGTVLRQQDWHYPSRGQCLQCHTAAGGHALGFNTVQLNRVKDFGDGPANQIEALSTLGYFDTAVSDLNTLPALSRPDETGVSLERRVRSYLQANCAQCHQPGGGALGYWDARINTATDNAGLVNGALVDPLGDPANRVLVPGDLAHSVLLQKISIRGSGQMPPLASAFADPAGIALISEWITNALPGRQTFDQWQVAQFGSTNDPNAAPDFDYDGDGANNRLEWLTGTDPRNPASVWRIGVDLAGDDVAIKFEQVADRGFELQFKGDFMPAGTWQVLDLPLNRPTFSSTNQAAVITDTRTNAATRFYRVHVFGQ